MIQESATWFLVVWFIWACIFYFVGRAHGKDKADMQHFERELERRIEQLEKELGK